MQLSYEGPTDAPPKAVPIFMHTKKEYGEEIYKQLKKGKTYAAVVYCRFFRLGHLDDPVEEWIDEAGARPLVKRIIASTNFTPPGVVQKETIEQTTSKFLLEFHDGLVAESVEIPMGNFSTLCISSQVGCKMGCTFCETGRMGLLRSLTTAEIVSQVFHSRHVRGSNIRNIVFMGMGEPFDNFENVSRAIRVLTERNALHFGPSQITVSTVGRVNEIYQMIDTFDTGVRLAISLNGSHDAGRASVMPITNTHNMGELKDAMRAYCAINKRKILIEYVMMDGINDSLEDAERVATYLQGVNVQAVNLIPYNSQSGIAKFQPSPDPVIDAFNAHLQREGYFVTVRRPKGRDIMAACGQLGNLHMKKEAKAKARERQARETRDAEERQAKQVATAQGGSTHTFISVAFAIAGLILVALWVRTLARRGVIPFLS